MKVYSTGGSPNEDSASAALTALRSLLASNGLTGESIGMLAFGAEGGLPDSLPVLLGLFRGARPGRWRSFSRQDGAGRAAVEECALWNKMNGGAERVAVAVVCSEMGGVSSGFTAVGLLLGESRKVEQDGGVIKVKNDLETEQGVYRMRKTQGEEPRRYIFGRGSLEPSTVLRLNCVAGSLGFENEEMRRKLAGFLSPSDMRALEQPLRLEAGDLMVENFIGVLGKGVDVVDGLLINGAQRAAALCGGEGVARRVREVSRMAREHSGGFACTGSLSLMRGLVHLDGLGGQSSDSLRASLDLANEALISFANTRLCRGMAERGGGVIDIFFDDLAFSHHVDRATVTILVDVREAMGANAVNSVAEGLSGPLAEALHGRVLLAVLTNLATDRLFSASLDLPVFAFAAPGSSNSGAQVAAEVAQLGQLASEEVGWAATVNMFVEQGVVAVGAACGQDTRALSAALHSFPAFTAGRYQGLPEFRIYNQGQRLRADLRLPVPMGVVGGSLASNPACLAALKIMGNPDVAELCSLACAVGLAASLGGLLELVYASPEFIRADQARP